ncbi:MAG: hypothetical protein JSV21_05395 [Nitrospirota bacterium]|nr:MAG: hypothetical protein JSV21_05395 [Nitrospirota bacterium]
MTLDEAIKIANEYIADAGDKYALDLGQVIEFDKGFCFTWNSKKYLRTRDQEDIVLGPSNFIVPKDGSDIFCLGSAYDMEELIEEFKEQMKGQ